MRFSTPVLDPPAKPHGEADAASGGSRNARARKSAVRDAGDDAGHGTGTGVAARGSRGIGRPAALAAFVLLGLLAANAIFAPLLSPDGAGAVAPENRVLAPSLTHPWGTDDLGRDVFVRAMRAGRYSLVAGLAAACIATFIGLLIGSVAGFRGGWTDTILMRLTDLALSIPVFFIVLLLAVAIAPGLLVVCLIIGVTQWMETARVVRAVVRSTRQHEFVDAARALGLSDRRILTRHVLSHTAQPVLVSGTLAVAQAIMVESALSFLGFGVQPPGASWGMMLQHAQSHLATAPWMSIFPGLLIFMTVLSFYTISDYLGGMLALDRR